ncbi:hypothetical protein [Methanomethylophilus alvi]|uniref:hypothetical protein n=1 Tax=Methanomethylophilus alvi TaxID=1291540 RepID=UPI0037DD98FF
MFYRIPGARRIERFASKACVLIMPTLAPDSVITEILDEAGVRMMKTVDAELVAEDRSMEHDVSIVKFLEERETMTLPVIKNRCLRYTDSSEEANVRIDEVLSSYSDGELCIERWVCPSVLGVVTGAGIL